MTSCEAAALARALQSLEVAVTHERERVRPASPPPARCASADRAILKRWEREALDRLPPHHHLLRRPYRAPDPAGARPAVARYQHNLELHALAAAQRGGAFAFGGRAFCNHSSAGNEQAPPPLHAPLLPTREQQRQRVRANHIRQLERQGLVLDGVLSERRAHELQQHGPQRPASSAVARARRQQSTVGPRPRTVGPRPRSAGGLPR